MAANTMKVRGILESELPRGSRDPQLPHVSNPSDYIKSTLKQDLPGSESKTVDAEMHWHFVLEKQALKNQKKIKKRKGLLSRKERTKLGLLKLPKEGWSYSQLEAMRAMWRGYMRDNLEEIRRAPGCTDQEWGAFGVILGKSEFVGAEMEVVRSRAPGLVGLKGTVVLETRSTFQIVGEDNKLRVLLKQPSVFGVKFNGMRFTIFGKHMLTKPSERSVKKNKTYLQPDL